MGPQEQHTAESACALLPLRNVALGSGASRVTFILSRLVWKFDGGGHRAVLTLGPILPNWRRLGVSGVSCGLNVGAPTPNSYVSVLPQCGGPGRWGSWKGIRSLECGPHE